MLNSQSQSASSSGGGFSLNPFSFGVSGGGGSNSTSSSSAVDLSAQTSANQFLSLAQQAAQYTDLQRSITVSSYEDSQTVSTTQRTLVNNNLCYAVNYFVRKVLDVYSSTTTVTLVTFQVTAGNYLSPVLTPAQIGQVDAQYRAATQAIIKGLPGGLRPTARPQSRVRGHPHSVFRCNRSVRMTSYSSGVRERFGQAAG